MSDTSDPWPEEGELLVCTVKGVKENGAYLNLNGYGEREGFVFIGEVAAGWVKNIRAHLREGQRVVAKVVNIKKDRQRVDLSIKAVSAERKKDTLQTWKNQQRASQIMRVAAERVNWDAEKTEAISEEMIEKFGSLYGALEECAITETALSDSGFSGEWMKVVTELAIENNYQYVICGHIHQPQQRVVTTDKGSVTYLNSGDWIENLTSLEYYDNAWCLYQYDPKQFEETNKKSKIIQLQDELSVITQEVAFQVSM